MPSFSSYFFSHTHGSCGHLRSKNAQPPHSFLLEELLQTPLQFYGAGMEVRLGLDSPILGGKHHPFLPFFQVLFLSFPNICLQYHVLLLKKLTYTHSGSQNLQLQNSCCFLE